MRNIIESRNGSHYLFADQEEFSRFKKWKEESVFTIVNNELLVKNKMVCRVIPVHHLVQTVEKVHKMSLESERKMPSPGWGFELYKEKTGFLSMEFTKKEWLNKEKEYVDVCFEILSPFEREESRSLVSYFTSGGLLEKIAPNVYYYYDRLFTKYGINPVVAKIEDVPDLEYFMRNYMPDLYKDLVETATYELIQEFNASPYVEKIIKNHYSYL